MSFVIEQAQAFWRSRTGTGRFAVIWLGLVFTFYAIGLPLESLGLEGLLFLPVVFLLLAIPFSTLIGIASGIFGRRQKLWQRVESVFAMPLAAGLWLAIVMSGWPAAISNSFLLSSKRDDYERIIGLIAADPSRIVEVQEKESNSNQRFWLVSPEPLRVFFMVSTGGVLGSITGWLWDSARDNSRECAVYSSYGKESDSEMEPLSRGTNFYLCRFVQGYYYRCTVHSSNPDGIC
jgi:hypothetical protein